MRARCTGTEETRRGLEKDVRAFELTCNTPTIKRNHHDSLEDLTASSLGDSDIWVQFANRDARKQIRVSNLKIVACQEELVVRAQLDRDGDNKPIIIVLK